jgi:hypothetical protein
MGGIVVRKYIVERQAELIEAGKEIDLFLVASPSLGSTWIGCLHWLSCLGTRRPAPCVLCATNNWMMDLDKEFMNLKEGGTLKIKGKELVEGKFIVLNRFWGRQVVEPFSGARYFGEPYKVPGSDHFSIAKPDDKNAIQHRLLCKFILENALSPGPETRDGLKPESEPPAPSLAAQKPPGSGALSLWQEKLAFLLAEEAKAVDPDQKFRLLKSIEEAKAKIREHGGHA